LNIRCAISITGQVAARRDHPGLVATVVGQADDPAQLQRVAEQADAGIRKLVHDLVAVEDSASNSAGWADHDRAAHHLRAPQLAAPDRRAVAVPNGYLAAG
jgi:hypothetical protein